VGNTHPSSATPAGTGLTGPGAVAPEGVRLGTVGIAAIAPNGVSLPTVPLLIGAGIVGVRIILAPIVNDGWDDWISAFSQISVTALACLAVVLGIRTAEGDHRHYGVRVLAGLVMVLAMSIAESLEATLPVSEWLQLAVFAGAIVLTIFQLTPLVASGLPRPVLVAAWLDMLIFFASGLAAVAVVAEWRQVAVGDATITVVTCLMGMLAWAATCASMLFVRGVRVWAGGPFFMLGGLALVAVGGASWIARVDTLRLDLFAPTDFLLAVGTVLIARGWLTWSLETRVRRSAWVVEVGRDMASTSAIMFAIIVVVMGPRVDAGATRIGVVSQVALLLGVILAGVRQVAIKEFERRARTAEALTSARLETEISDRGRVSIALEGVEPASSIHLTAERLCARLLTLPCADFVLITAMDGDGGGIPLAASGVITFGLVGMPIGEGQVARLRSKAADGIWTEPAAAWLEPWLPVALPNQQPIVAHAPLIWEDGCVGILSMGSIDMDPDGAGRRLATAREAAVLVAALVGPALATETAARHRRQRIDEVIAHGRFHPVYQPIVELATERIVGFEALTRFADGGRPDLWFHEAAAAGRGVELEVATLTAAVREAGDLPPECYLSLNLSADLASAVDILGKVLTRIPRALLLEITEHVPVEDYERMMANLYALDIQIRIAVDDAGAGYSGLQHILALHPHVVKLDATLVRSVDVDVARQAIVGAMVSFAARTGCTIVAEGVETASEVAMVRSLGVSLAQGYYFGHPRRAAEWRVNPVAPDVTPAPPTRSPARRATSVAGQPGPTVPSC
jgi:EAL domain-containing protein (putative c-di-GMP-specific phosphodiesterase class I)